MRDDRRCPELEEIAALAEGRLKGRRRRELAAHLDGCRNCYDIFVDTIRFRLEESAAGTAGTVERFPARRRWPRIVAAMAAAAALLLAVGVLIRQQTARNESVGAPKLSRTAPAPPAQPIGTPANGQQPVLRTLEEVPAPASFYATQFEELTGDEPMDALRSALADPLEGGGFSFGGTVSGNRLYLRLGVRLMDLSVARYAGDNPRTGPLQSEVAQLAAAAGLIGLPSSPAEWSRQLPALLPAEADRLCRLGYWAEGGRLAAKLRRPGYFDATMAHNFSRTARSAGLPPGMARTLEGIGDRLATGVPDDAEWQRLERDFSGVVLLF